MKISAVVKTTKRHKDGYDVIIIIKVKTENGELRDEKITLTMESPEAIFFETLFGRALDDLTGIPFRMSIAPANYELDDF